MFDVKTLQVADLRGGRIGEIVKSALASGDERYDGMLTAASSVGEAVCTAFEQAFGWRPPRELAEYVSAEAALGDLANDSEDFWLEELGGWMFSLDLCDLSPEAREAGSYFSWAEDPLTDPMLLVTGLVGFGGDASGDSCFVSLLPHPDDSSEVWVYDHEVGKIDRHLGYTITDALLSAWLDEDQEPEYFEMAEERLGGDDWNRGRPAYLLGDDLLRRADWLISLLRGDPGYAFESRLGAAPTFETWQGELASCREHPHLAFYWMFSHYFFGNDEACREALEFVESSGTLGKALSTSMRLLLKGSSLGLGEIEPEKLAEFRALVRANAEPAQLEPAARKALSEERGEVTIDPEELARQLVEGTPMQIIEANPDNVSLHDEMLARVALEDDEFGKLVARYLDERNDRARNEWPYGAKTLDARLAIPVSAAFRAGLKFGDSHKKAFAGITRTLRKFDDEHALEAYGEAIDKLAPTDERLEYVIAQLSTSQQEGAHALLVRGALRFFDNIDALAKTKATRAKEWPSLDDLFRVDDYFIRALLEAMRPSDTLNAQQRADVEMLARRTLANGGQLATLGVAWARAMQAVATYELDDLVYLAQGYIETFRDALDHSKEQLSDTLVINLAESAQTLALRDPEAARRVLRPMFVRRYAVPAYQADVVGALLAGMVIIEPEANDVLRWTERILGSRDETRPLRLYGTLVGVAGAKLAAASPWVRPHLYSGFSGISAARDTIGNAAVRALGAFGVPETEILPFDDDDWYASELHTEDELLAALDRPHLHSAEHVFKRLREENMCSPAIAERLGDWLVESLRFAADDHDRGSDRDRLEALKVLLMRGPHAVSQFTRVFALDNLGATWLGYMVQFARFSAMFDDTQRWLATVSDDELQTALAERWPTRLAFLDHLAAEAMVRGLDASDSLRAACDWRFALPYSYSVRDDLVASRLPRLYALSTDATAYCRAQLEGADSITEDYWKQALEFDHAPEPKKLEKSGSTTLTATEEKWFGPTLKMKLTLKKADVTLVASVKGFAGRGVFDSTWTGETSWSHDSADAARDQANQLLKRLALLGFT